MIDFQVCFPSEVISLTSVRVLSGVSPLTLDVSGKDFSAVDEVRINDALSPSVVVLTRTRLTAQVPVSIGPVAAIDTLTVTSNRLTLTKRSLIRFRVGRVASKVRGILRLVQTFLKILFTKQGTDIFTQRIGADALRNVGRTFGKSQSDNIRSDFVLAVSTARKQLIAIQGRDPSIPRDERMLSARVLSSQFSQQMSALLVTVELVSQAGQAAVANVMV